MTGVVSFSWRSAPGRISSIDRRLCARACWSARRNTSGSASGWPSAHPRDHFVVNPGDDLDYLPDLRSSGHTYRYGFQQEGHSLQAGDPELEQAQPSPRAVRVTLQVRKFQWLLAPNGVPQLRRHEQLHPVHWTNVSVDMFRAPTALRRALQGKRQQQANRARPKKRKLDVGDRQFFYWCVVGERRPWFCRPHLRIDPSNLRGA